MQQTEALRLPHGTRGAGGQFLQKEQVTPVPPEQRGSAKEPWRAGTAHATLAVATGDFHCRTVPLSSLPGTETASLKGSNSKRLLRNGNTTSFNC